MHDVFDAAAEATVDTTALATGTDVVDTASLTGVGAPGALVTLVAKVDDDTATGRTMTDDKAAGVDVEAGATEDTDCAGVVVVVVVSGLP